MQKAVYVLLTNTFETIEALTVVDVFRRADFPIFTVSLEATKNVVSGQNIKIEADMMLEDMPSVEQQAAIYIPGGLPAAANISENKVIQQMVIEAHEAGVTLASLCAGPFILETTALSKGIKGTCFPAVKDKLSYVEYVNEFVVEDNNILTSRAAATSIYLALALLKKLAGEEIVAKVEEGMQQDFVNDHLA